MLAAREPCRLTATHNNSRPEKTLPPAQYLSIGRRLTLSCRCKPRLLYPIHLSSMGSGVKRACAAYVLLQRKI